MGLTGYPVEDLALRASFVDASQARDRSSPPTWPTKGSATCGRRAATSTAPAYGASTGSAPPRAPPELRPAVIHQGRVVARDAKHHLPNYGVFDEFRTSPRQHPAVVRVRGIDVAIAICEDLWQEGGPVAVTKEAGAGLLLVINGSPYEEDKDDTAVSLARRAAARPAARSPTSTWSAARTSWSSTATRWSSTRRASVLARGPQFREDLLVVDLDLPPTSTVTRPTRPRASCTSHSPTEPLAPYDRGARRRTPRGWTRSARSTRRSPRAARLRAQERLPVGAARRLRRHRLDPGGGDRVRRARAARTSSASPTRAATPAEHSQDDAAELAARPGLDYRVIPISRWSARSSTTSADRRRRGEPPGARAGARLDGAVEPGGPPGPGQQQQVRAVGRLLDHLRRQRRRVRPDQGRAQDPGLGTGPVAQRRGGAPRRDAADPREHDHQGAVGRAAPGPGGPGLAPPYEVLDAILDVYVEGTRAAPSWSPPASTQVVDKVVRLVDRAEWKRRQIPPDPRSPAAFGRDRRLPITNAWREDARKAAEH